MKWGVALCGFGFILGAANAAGAAEDPAVAKLANALSVPALRIFGRVGILASADRESPETRAVCATVAAAFARAGHGTTIIEEPQAGLVPERALLMKAWTEQHANAVAIVRTSTALEHREASVVLYDLAGAPVFRAVTTPGEPRTDGPSWTAWAIVDPAKFPGPAFYEELGRDDLVRSYHHRAVGKTLSRIAGGVVLAVALWRMSLAILGTIDTDSKPEVGIWYQAMVPAGVALLVVPTFISTDPLSGEERWVLGQRGDPPRAPLGVIAAPLPGGGGLVLGGSF